VSTNDQVYGISYFVVCSEGVVMGGKNIGRYVAKRWQERLECMWIKTSPRPIRDDAVTRDGTGNSGVDAKVGGKNGSPPGRFFDFSSPVE
jgi:hypothetical protein